MSPAITSTLTVTATHPHDNNGNISPLTAGKAMDVQTRLTLNSEHSDPQSTAPHDPPPPATQIPDAASSTVKTSLVTEPSPVLERPRQDGTGEGAGQGQPLIGQMAKPSVPTSYFSSNLISVLGLDPLAATVARFDPKTGEKINRMRKSYENHLKALGLSGRNKAIKHSEALESGADNMMGLCEMAEWPEDEWQNQKVHGKDIKKGLPDPIKAKLEKAFTLNPGSVPEAAKWEDILGLERPNPNNSKVRKDPKVNGQTPNGAAARSPAQNTAPTAAENEHIRARRNNKKRRYNDEAYEGYGEGWVDDEMDNEGYESGETYTSRNSRGSRGDKKRRKTLDFGKSYAAGGSRAGSSAR